MTLNTSSDIFSTTNILDRGSDNENSVPSKPKDLYITLEFNLAEVNIRIPCDN